jgi:hypothetical protein
MNASRSSFVARLFGSQLSSLNVCRRATRTRIRWELLGQAAFIGLGIYLSASTFAEEVKPKADDKDNDKVERRIEAEANLPGFYQPIKGLHANSLSKSAGETRGSLLPQPQARFPRLTPMHRPSQTNNGQPELRPSTRLSSSNSKVLAKLDSLAQTQDKVRQRTLYGFKADKNAGTTPSQPAPLTTPSALEKVSTEKPVVVSTPQNSLPQTAITKIPISPNNTAIWTKNDSMPHRGIGSSTLGGPANGKNTGINGTEMKIRP